jgi:proliferating cell nuclear antigen
MEAVYESSKFLFDLLLVVQGVIDEINFEFTENGLEFQAIDSSHVSLVGLNLPKASFIGYQIQKRFNIGIKLSSMLAILKTAEVDDHVKFMMSDGDDKLKIIFSKSFATNEEISTYELKLIEIDQEMLSIPDYEEFCEIRMSSKKLFKMCKDFINFSDTINITILNKEVVEAIIEWDGEKASGNKKLYHKTDKIEIRTSVDKFQAAFSLTHLCHFTKAQSISDIVVIKLKDNAPIMLIYVLPNDGRLTFFLAPKSQEN